MTEEEFKYYAFMSYSSKDEKHAKKLHRKLENYRIPRALVNRPGRDGPTPRKLFPIFRDRDEFPLSSDLGSTIHDALRASRYLIVICSPNATASEWVNEEIRYFKSLGRADRILAIIVDGEPTPANEESSARECFPPALRHHVNDNGELDLSSSVEPIGGDLRKGKDGWKACFLKAIAGITGLGYNTFAKREKKRQRLRRISISAVAVVLLACGIGWWDYTRVKTDYYSMWGEPWGTPMGIVPIQEDVVSHRNVSYRVRSTRGKVRSIESINGSMHPVDSMFDKRISGAARIDLQYGESGMVSTVVYSDRHGEELGSIEYSPDLSVLELKMPQTSARPLTLGGVSESVTNQFYLAAPSLEEDPLDSKIVDMMTEFYRGLSGGRTAVQKLRRTFDEKGRVNTVAYLDIFGEPISNDRGVLGERYEYNRLGQVTRLHFIDEDGEQMVDRSGVAGSRFEYSNRGLMTQDWTFDATGSPVMSDHGFASRKFTKDPWGNPAQLEHFDDSGQPVMLATGFSVMASEYDSRGNNVLNRYLDMQGREVVTLSGYSCARSKHDQNGFHTETRYFGPDGGPAIDRSRRSGWRAVNDSAGNNLKFENLARDGSPGMHRNGYSGYTAEYQSGGKVSRKVFLDVRGERCLTKDGYCEVRYEYDEFGRLIGKSHYGINGDPVPANYVDAQGVSEIRYGYDKETGNYSAIRFFDEAGDPAVNQNGAHGVDVLFYGDGTLKKLSFVSVDEELIVGADGYAEIRVDHTREATILEAFDAEGAAAFTNNLQAHRLVIHKNPLGVPVRQEWFLPSGEKWAELDVVRDDVQRMIETSARYADGSPKCDPPLGVSRLRFTLDEAGRASEIAVLEPDDSAGVNREGFSKAKREFDQFGRITSISYFGPDEKRVTTNQGVHRIVIGYNERGQLSGISGYDEQEKAVRSSVTARAALIRAEYDSFGRLVETRFYDKAGDACLGADGYHLLRRKLDDLGRVTEQSFFGPSEEKVSGPIGGVHRVTVEYDAFGRELVSRYFDVNGDPALDGSKVHCYVNEYDRMGRLVANERLGLKEEAVLNAEGVHRTEVKHDLNGNELKRSLYGVNKEPVMSLVEGYHRYEQAYDSRGRVTELKAHGLTENGMLVGGGFLRITNRYGNGNEPIEQRVFGRFNIPTVFPVSDLAGVHRKVSEYDERGFLTKESHFDVNDEEALTSTGYHSVVYKNNFAGETVEQLYLDRLSQPTDSSLGYSLTKYKHDARGDRTEQSFYLADGTPVQGAFGYATSKIGYDASGRRTTVSFFAADESPCRGPEGYHAIQRVYLEQGKVRDEIEDEQGRALTSVVMISEVVPGENGAKAGVQARDIVAGYREWSAVDESFGNVGEVAMKSLRNAILKGRGNTALSVIRGNSKVLLDVAEGLLSVHLKVAYVPTDELKALLENR